MDIRPLFQRSAWILIVSLLISSAHCASALTVDSFEAPIPAGFVPAGGPVAQSTATSIGGVRVLTVQDPSSGAYMIVGSGNAILNNGVGASARGVIQWHGSGGAFNPAGLGGVNFFQDGGTKLILKVLSFDFPSNKSVQLEVRVYNASDTSGMLHSRATITLSTAVTTETDFVIPFGDFVQFDGNAPAATSRASDFEKVGAIQLTYVVDNAPAADVAIGWIGTDGQCLQIPDAAGKVIDVCNVCAGDGTSCLDCLGEPFGPATEGTACQNTLTHGVCVNGVWDRSGESGQCYCNSPQPGPRRCNGLDNDCDGVSDNLQYPNYGTACGVGQDPCVVPGTVVCSAVGDGTRCSADSPDSWARVKECLDSRGCDGIPGSGKVLDVCGICGGDGTSCLDCLGTPFGTAVSGTPCQVEGALGVCAAGVWTKPNGVQCVCYGTPPGLRLCNGRDNDCDGVIDNGQIPGYGEPCSRGDGACAVNGSIVCSPDGGVQCSADRDDIQATIKACEASRGCDGVPASGKVVDDCGICGGDGSTCRDCLGQKGGVAVLDRCGVCNGDGKSCLGCTSRDITPLLAALDGGAKKQEKVAKRIAILLGARDKQASTKKWIEDILAEAHRLQIKNWVLSWTVPGFSVSCSNAIFCVSASNDPIIDEYKENAKKLQTLTRRLLIKLVRSGYNPDYAKKVEALGNKYYKENLKLTEKVPRIQSNCG